MNSNRSSGLVFALLLSLGSSRATWAAETTPPGLPDAPSATNQSYAPDSASSSHVPPQSGAAQESADPEQESFLRRWAKRGLRDQADIYTAPFHKSALAWDIGLPAVTLGLIALDKHASGELSRAHLNVSRDISSVGLYGSAGAVGLLLLDGAAYDHPHAKEAGVLGAEAMANSTALYAILQLMTERERPLQDAGKGHFWQTSGLDNSFPSGHAIITWTAATTIAHEYPKPWVEWLAYGTATTVSVTRFTGLRHFPSDVVVGSTLGYLVGRHIFHAHCKAGLSSACSAK